MVDVASVVERTSREFGPKSLDIPRPVLLVFSSFHKVYRVWRWIRRAEVYTNKDNLLYLTAGHALSLAVGDKTPLLLRVSVLSLQVARRILDVIRQKKRLQVACWKWSCAVKGYYQKPIKVVWVRQSKLSPSTVYWLRYNTQSLINRIRRVMINTLLVVKEAFLLSMRIMDAVEAFYMSPDHLREGINEVFVNGSEIVTSIAQNGGKIKRGLQENRKLINRILIYIQSPLTADVFIRTVVRSIENTEQTNQEIKEVSNNVGSFLFGFAKKTAFGFLSELGLGDLFPRNHVPPPYYPFDHSTTLKTPNPRYPKKEKITKPSILVPPKVNGESKDPEKKSRAVKRRIRNRVRKMY